MGILGRLARGVVACTSKGPPKLCLSLPVHGPPSYMAVDETIERFFGTCDFIARTPIARWGKYCMVVVHEDVAVSPAGVLNANVPWVQGHAFAYLSGTSSLRCITRVPSPHAVVAAYNENVVAYHSSLMAAGGEDPELAAAEQAFAAVVVRNAPLSSTRGSFGSGPLRDDWGEAIPLPSRILA